MLLVDLSNNNSPVDVKRLAHVTDIVGLWHKATEGASFIDKYHNERRFATKGTDLRFGSYHFARPDQGNSPSQEAEHFCNVVGQIDRRDLRPALDLESGSPYPSYVKWAREFNHYVKRNLGVLPLFYSYPSYIEGLRADVPIGSGLWLASVGPGHDTTEHSYTVPRPWKKAVAHQFSWYSNVAGVAGYCDLSSAKSLRPLLAHPISGRV